MDRLGFYSGWRGIDRVELREPAETLPFAGDLGRGDVRESLGTLLHPALGGLLMIEGDRAKI